MIIREIAQDRLNSPVSKHTIKGSQEAIACAQRSINYYNSLPSWKQGYETQERLTRLAQEIEILTAIIEILTEQAEVAVAAESVQIISTLVKSVPKTTVMRKMVAIAANKLRKFGLSLSECFKRAWKSMKSIIINYSESEVKQC